MSRPCNLCGHVGAPREHVAREMMFGSRESFTYAECDGCGALVLVDPPADLSAFYPDDYYSYGADRPERFPALQQLLKRARARAALGGGSLLDRLVLARFGTTPQLGWLRRLGLGLDASILDVGCGAGELLRELHRDGFRRLKGIDLFLDADLEPAPGLHILRRGLAEEDTRHDLVMLHHSLEHMPDQAAVFAGLRRVVRPGGAVLIRIPVADSAAWREYGVDWVQLDAPRHLVLHTDASLERIAAAAGFRLEHVENDSTAFQFWGSEQYRRDVPLRDPRSHGLGGAGTLFTTAELLVWAERAAALNAAGEGDQRVYFLRRSPD